MLRRVPALIAATTLAGSLLVALPGLAQAPVPDYSGTWELDSTATLPNDGGTCVFQGTIALDQVGDQLAGTGLFVLISGPQACPTELPGSLTGQVQAGGCVEMGMLTSQLGTGSFSGCPGNLPGSLSGSYQVASGAYAGTLGQWDAVPAQQSILEIPTLSALGLAALVVLLLAAGALVLRRRAVT